MAESEHSPDSFVFKSDRPWPNARLKVAAIVGHANGKQRTGLAAHGAAGEFALRVYAWEAAVESAGARPRSGPP